MKSNVGIDKKRRLVSAQIALMKSNAQNGKKSSLISDQIGLIKNNAQDSGQMNIRNRFPEGWLLNLLQLQSLKNWDIISFSTIYALFVCSLDGLNIFQLISRYYVFLHSKLLWAQSILMEMTLKSASRLKMCLSTYVLKVNRYES